MVLLWRVDAVDPVTCISVIENNVVLVGTALGAVKLFYRPALDQPFASVGLSNRSQEPIAGIVVEDGCALAVVGDVAVRRWDLRALAYDTPIVRGCKYDEVFFLMKHSAGLCSSSLSFFSPRTRECGPRVFIMRVNGDCCFLEPSTQTQFQRDNVGPMSSSEETVGTCAFNGTMAAFIVRGSDHICRLKVWMVWDTPRQIPLSISWKDHAGSFRGARFVNEDAMLILLDRQLFFCRFRDNVFARVRAHGTVFMFDHLVLNDALFVIFVSRGGRICMMELQDWATSSFPTTVTTRAIKPTRSLKSHAQFLLDVPYFVRAHRSAQLGFVSIVFNDDAGIQIEENLFQV